MNLNLTGEKPVVFIKVQTTGVDPKKDRIIELSLIKFEKDEQPKFITRRFNPGIEISEESYGFHGISNLDVSEEAAFESKAEGIKSFLKGCDFVGFSIRNFDIPFIVSEMYRAGVEFVTFNSKFIDLHEMYSKMNAKTFINAVSDYCDKTIEDSLSSEEFLKESVNLYNNMVSRSVGKKLDNLEIEEDFNMLSTVFDPNFGSLDVDGRVVINSDGKPVFSFGKHKGKEVSDVLTKEDQGYFQWIMNSDFSFDTKNVVKKILKRAKSEELA